MVLVLVRGAGTVMEEKSDIIKMLSRKSAARAVYFILLGRLARTHCNRVRDGARKQIVPERCAVKMYYFALDLFPEFANIC
jgi:hypothetical protein